MASGLLGCELSSPRVLISISFFTAHCSLLTAYCLLPTAHCLPLTAYRFLIDLSQTVENQVRITRCFNRDREELNRCFEIENAAGDFHDLTESLVRYQPAALRADNLSIVKEDPAGPRAVLQCQSPGLTRILNCLNRVEHADDSQITGESHTLLAGEWSAARRGRIRFQFRMPRAANRFQTRGDRDSIIELFRFQQTVVGCVKVVPFDVKARQRQTMTCSFFRMFMRGRNFAQLFAQAN